MTAVTLLIVALVVFIGLWAIFRYQRKPLSTGDKDDNETEIVFQPDFEFATEVFPHQEEPLIQELPWAYGDNRIILLARDPNWLYTYWEVHDDQNHFDAHLILRVYDVTPDLGQPRSHFDIHVDGFNNNWYIHVGKPNRSFCVGIGWLFKDGSFSELARSNYCHTPRNGVSDKVDPEWMAISELYGEVDFGLSSAGLYDQS